MKTLILPVCGAAFFVAACSAPVDRRLVVDGTRNAAFETDYAHCHALARSYSDGSTKEAALAGAAVGAVAVAVDAEKEDRLGGAVAGAGLGALLGAAGAQEDLDKERRNVLIRCMQNRGHRVVG